jgi:hypothetical protein
MPNDTSVMNEWNGWQIPHTGVPEPDRDDWARGSDDADSLDVFTTIRRALDMRASNFGALNVGRRMAQGMDYTRTELTYITKDKLSDLNVITADDGAPYGGGLRGTTVEYNPYLWGSTVKRARDDQFFRMTMEHSSTSPTLLGDDDFSSLYPAGAAASIDKPTFDVMDTDAAQAEGMNAYKNYPSEGWRSFGGKYDFLPYTGILGRPRGNERA